jgi:hypothetical protein
MGTGRRRVVALMALVGLSYSVPARAATGPHEYFSVLFSRSEISAADGPTCQEDDTNIARTDTVVAPYLTSLGIRATGSLETAATQDSTIWCSHYGYTAAMSWATAQTLAQQQGWSFVSHSATYPSASAWGGMTSDQLSAETCGSAATITAHGLPGAHGMFAWPGSYMAPNALPYVEQCFAVSRGFGGNGISWRPAITTPPYRVSTTSFWGGACHDPALPCYSLQTPVRYMLPGEIVQKLNGLKLGQWLSTQAYVLVTGTNPPYQTDTSRWDCTSPNPADHWSNDAERYCYSDFQAVMAAVSAKVRSGQLVSADPGTIAAAFGR